MRTNPRTFANSTSTSDPAVGKRDVEAGEEAGAFLGALGAGGKTARAQSRDRFPPGG